MNNYLLIDGIKGEAQSKGVEGAFNIVNYTRPLKSTLTSSTKAGVGQAGPSIHTGGTITIYLASILTIELIKYVVKMVIIKEINIKRLGLITEQIQKLQKCIQHDMYSDVTFTRIDCVSSAYNVSRSGIVSRGMAVITFSAKSAKFTELDDNGNQDSYAFSIDKQQTA